MKTPYFLFAVLFSICCCAQESPKTRKIPATLTRHNISYSDDYSWLENYKSPEVVNWVAAQNRTDKNKPVSIFYRKDINEDPRQLVDLFDVFKTNNVFITGTYPSVNSRILAYKVSVDGSDRNTVRFVDIDKSKDLDDVLHNIKFSNVAWNQEKGVFYKKNNNIQKFAADSTYQLYYHRIGRTQEEDDLVYDSTVSGSSFSFFTKENKLFIIETNKEETKQDYYSCTLNGDVFKPEKIVENETSATRFLHYSKERIYYSSSESDWGEIRSFDTNNRQDEKTLIPQIYTHLLEESFFYDDYIVCKYKTVGKNYMIVYDREGKFVRKFDVPYGMDFKVQFFDNKTNDLYVTFYSYTISYLNYRLNVITGKTGPFFTHFIQPKPSLFPFDYFETKTITYKSRDGNDIPMTIVYKKGLKMDGNNPTLLKAYGGFGTVSGPVYDTGLLYFLEKDGIFAYAEIRGGGEKGLEWHRDGMGLKKINSFTDFIDAAEFLINEKYTSPAKLAITGASQGGLLVGVALTMRPELFKVAIPEVGVYDMAKYDQYTVGNYHLDEYGNPAVAEDFKALMAYSPYHNVKENINYPITLIITSENDDRVPPIHSYKFAARLQDRTMQKNPIYLKTTDNSGHNGKVANYKDYIGQSAEFYSFLLYHLNQ